MSTIKTLSMFVIAAGATILTSCQQDMFDGKRDIVKDQYAESWTKKFGDIDPEQDWNSASRVTVNMSITEDALAEYKLQVLTGDPVHDPDARLVGTTTVTTDAQGKASASIEVDYLKGNNTIYVASRDARGYYLVKTATIVNGVATAEFGVAEGGVARSRASINEHDLPSMDCPYTAAEVNGFISSGKTITPQDAFVHQYSQYDIRNSNNICNMGPDDNKNYVIAGTWTDNIFLEASTGMYGTSNGQPYYPNVGEFHVVVTGKLAVTNQWALLLGACDLIIADGGVLDVTNCKMQLQDKGRIIVMPGGKVIDNNAGEGRYAWGINADANTGVIYNGGEMDIRVMNINSTNVYNANIMKADMILIENENAVYSNFGKTYVKTITGNGSQGTINNNCYLFSDTEITCLYLNEGANSSVECNNITFCEATLRENSMIKTQHLNNHADTQSNYGGGWYTLVNYCGTEDGAAILSAEELTYINVGPADGSTFSIKGRVFFEYNTLGSTLDNPDYARQAIAAGTTNCLGVAGVGKANYNIPEGDCTGSGHPTNTPPAPTPDPDPTPTPTPDPEPGAQSWIIAAEDLGSTDDYDFNDVVIMVSHAAGQTTATVTPLAAGGTYASDIWFGDQSLGEIHGMFGITTGTSGSLPMLNTGNGTATATGTPKTINVPADFSVTYGNCNFRMVTNNGSQSMIIDSATAGDAPQVIIVPSNWWWPKERVNIEDAYPLFKNWSQNAGANTEWYKSESYNGNFDFTKVYNR